MSAIEEAKNYIKSFEEDLKQNNFNNVFGDYFKHVKHLSKEAAQEVINIFINADVNFFNYLRKVLHYQFKEMELPNKIIGPNIETIGDLAFSNTNIEAIYFPNCEYIGDMAFSNCSKLKSINLDKAELLGNNIFYNCESLTKISLPNAVGIGSSSFAECFALEELYIPSYSTPYPLEDDILDLFTARHDYFNLKYIYITMGKDGVAPVTLKSNTRGYDRVKKHFPNLKVMDANTKEIIKDYTK